MAIFKSLSDNSNIYVISVLVSVDCLFSFKFNFFFCSWIDSDFQLKLGPFGCCETLELIYYLNRVP